MMAYPVPSNQAIPSQEIPQLRILWCVTSRHRAAEIASTVLALPFGTYFPPANPPHRPGVSNQPMSPIFVFRYYNIRCDNPLRCEARRGVVVWNWQPDYLAYSRKGWHVVLHGHIYRTYHTYLYAHLGSSKHFHVSLRSLLFTFGFTAVHSTDTNNVRVIFLSVFQH